MYSPHFPTKANQKRSRKWTPESRQRRSGGMLAIDTNLIVRYLTGDHPAQSARAGSLIDGNDIFVSTTVLLETARVLRSVYAYPADQFSKALRAFAGLPGVTLEAPRKRLVSACRAIWYTKTSKEAEPCQTPTP
jgi:hypothetical protein